MSLFQQPDAINGASTATGQGFNPAALNNQNNNLLGNQPGTPGMSAQLTPDFFNNSDLQNNPQVAAMIKALKGGSI